MSPHNEHSKIFNKILVLLRVNKWNLLHLVGEKRQNLVWSCKKAVFSTFVC